MRLNIAPVQIGKTDVRRVTFRMVQEWLVWLRDPRDLSGRGRQLALTAVRQCLKAAKVAELVRVSAGEVAAAIKKTSPAGQ